MTLLDLGRLNDVTLPPLPVDLRGAIVSLPFHALCPFCGVRRAGLLAGHCGEPDCRTAYLDADQALARLEDQ
jgi:hypothetical protein